MPCFCFGKKPFCYLWTDKQSGEPYILIVDGDKIEHQALEQGDRKKMKVLSIASQKDIPLNLINEILSLAKGTNK